jgi:hypothetical protein
MIDVGRVLPHCHFELTNIMRLYQNLDVNLTYQNFGSTWALVLRGKTEDIEQAANGLYNWGATNGDCEFYDHAQTVGVIWTDKPSLQKFFENVIEQQLFNEDKPMHAGVKTEAEARIQEMQSCHENFFDFANRFVPETYGTGTMTAERPDADMKDAILQNAFADKEKS